MNENITTCRVCLSTTTSKYVSLFDKHKDTFIADQINSLTNVQIKEGDGLPNKICGPCLIELDTAVHFRKKCETTNSILLINLNNQLNHLPCHKKVDEIELNDHLSTDLKDEQSVIVKKEEPDLETLADFICGDVYETHYDEEEKKPVFEESSSSACGNSLLIGKNYTVENITDKSNVLSKYLCDDCGSLFKSKCKLRVHWKKVHLSEKLMCLQCKRRFKSFAAFNNHQRNKRQSCMAAKNFRIEGEGRQRVFYCKECNYKSIRMKDMMTHWVIHTGDRPYKCDMCSHTCTQLASLSAHKESVHREYKQEITCQYCGKFVKGRGNVYRHLKTHRDNSKQCPICNKILKNTSGLTQHMYRHSGYKSFTCERCARSFYTIAELSNHRTKVHHNNKAQAIKCKECDYKSGHRGRMKKHESNHKEGAIPCTVCGMFFESAQKLSIHQRRHFDPKKYFCPYCECKYFRKDSVMKHVKSKHLEAFLRSKRLVGFSGEDKNVIDRKDIEIFHVMTDVVRSQSMSPVQSNDNL